MTSTGLKKAEAAAARLEKLPGLMPLNFNGQIRDDSPFHSLF